jgi:hypothetical protein
MGWMQGRVIHTGMITHQSQWELTGMFGPNEVDISIDQSMLHL